MVCGGMEGLKNTVKDVLYYRELLIMQQGQVDFSFGVYSIWSDDV